MGLFQFFDPYRPDLRWALRVHFGLQDDMVFAKFARKAVKAFLAEMGRVHVEALLDAVWQARTQHMTSQQRQKTSRPRTVAIALGWRDVSSVHKVAKTGSLASAKRTLIEVFYRDWIRLDPVHAIKRGYQGAIGVFGDRRPELKGSKIDMAQLDGLIRIFSSKKPIEEASKDPEAQRWVRAFLLAVTIVSDEHPESLDLGP
jgi:hypothetical protein